MQGSSSLPIVAVVNQTSIAIKACGKGDFELLYVTPLGVDGVTLLGEAGKIVPHAPARFTSGVTLANSTFAVELAGSLNEQVDVLWYADQAHAIQWGGDNIVGSLSSRGRGANSTSYSSVGGSSSAPSARPEIILSTLPPPPNPSFPDASVATVLRSKCVIGHSGKARATLVGLKPGCESD
jgi:hypothetical protein